LARVHSNPPTLPVRPHCSFAFHKSLATESSAETACIGLQAPTPTSDPRYRVCNFTPELPYLGKKLSNFIGQFPGYVGQLEADCIVSPAPQQLRAPTARSVPGEILLLLLYPTE
jgi:hypothetical protein